MTSRGESQDRDVLGPLRPSEDDLAFVDSLTGLCNQRLLAQLLDDKWAEIVDLLGSFAVVMIDLDLFKEVNDRYGHLSGDQVLRTTAEILQKTFRESDLLFRYGGDEFVVLLPGATVSDAETLGERAREAMESHEFLDSEEMKRIDVPLSFSIGVAAYPGDGETGREVLSAADDRLYVEKRLQVAARRRKRALVTGVVISLAIVLLIVSLTIILDRQPERIEAPRVVVEPAVKKTDAATIDDREALLLQITELQGQIESLRATRDKAGAKQEVAHITALEEKVRELTGQLQQADAAPPLEAPAKVVERPAVEPVRVPPAAVQVETDPPVPVRVVVTPPRLMKRLVPVYPSFAQERGIEATIELDILVDATGRVTEAVIRGEPVGFGFEEAARKAALASEWTPGRRDGTPVPMRANLEVRFQISR